MLMLMALWFPKLSARVSTERNLVLNNFPVLRRRDHVMRDWTQRRVLTTQQQC